MLLCKSWGVFDIKHMTPAGKGRVLSAHILCNATDILITCICLCPKKFSRGSCTALHPQRHGYLL